MPIVLANPAPVDLVNRHWIQIMQLLAPAPDDDNQVRRFEQTKVLGDRLARHVQVPAQIGQRLAVALVQLIEQLPAAAVRQRFEHCIHSPENMQPKGCMSMPECDIYPSA